MKHTLTAYIAGTIHTATLVGIGFLIGSITGFDTTWFFIGALYSTQIRQYVLKLEK
jgi:hypothetical protein